ncbi:MAG: CotH kinase family protein, partial [Planctomycetota bacterium]
MNSRSIYSHLVFAASLLGLAAEAATQPGGPPGGGPRFRKTELVQQFDKNKDGWLNDQERAAAREWLRDNPRQQRRGRGGRGGGRGGFGRRGREAEPEPENAAAQKPLTPGGVPHYPKKKLYDMDIVRTLFLEFPGQDWEEEVAAFYRTDVCVPAKLTVDGKTYPNVGVRFRGNSSYFGVPAGRKRSLNISMDLANQRQRLYRYKTLNLLNCHLPATKANYVRVVINGESWGIYANVQQFNTDFLRDNFGTRRGVRWKVPPNFGGDAGLRYLGEDEWDYRDNYELKTGNARYCWPRLIRLCSVVDQVSAAERAKMLPKILDIDSVLWFLALDNVFMDGDGYHSRASDYALYEDPRYRFHLFFYDNNEVMRGGGGGGRGGGRGGFGGRGGGRGPGGPSGPMSPLQAADDYNRPLARALLSNPAWRARYLAHVRTTTRNWLDWEKVGPVFRQYQQLIDADIRRDRKRLYGYAEFQRGVEGAEGEREEGAGARRGRRSRSLRSFVTERYRFLMEHRELKGPWPEITAVTHKEVPGEAGMKRLRVTARVGTNVAVDRVLLYFRLKRLEPFRLVTMHDDGKHGDGAAGDRVFAGDTPPLARGTRIRYYVEARAPQKIGSTTFHPEKAAA